MDRKTTHTRRVFIKSGLLSTAAIAILLWDKMVGRHREITNAKTISVSFNPNQEVSFFDEFIIVNRNGEIKVLSSRCTHLGCRINQQSGSSLLCPCHGSAYNLSGNVTKGPALKSLNSLSFQLSDDKKIITVGIT